MSARQSISRMYLTTHPRSCLARCFVWRGIFEYVHVCLRSALVDPGPLSTAATPHAGARDTCGTTHFVWEVRCRVA